MIEASAGMISAGEPEAEDPETSQEMQAIDEEKLEMLGTSLASRRDEWIAARRASGVEKRWTEDLDQYHGRDASTKQAATMMEAAEQGYPVNNREAKAQRSTVYVNITRPKTNAAEARLANMLFPSDDRNWGLKPSPAPELIKVALAEAEAAGAAAAAAAAPPPGAPPAGAPAGALPPGVGPTSPAQPGGTPPAYPGAPPQLVAPGMPMPGNGMPPGMAHPSAADSATGKIAEATTRCKAMQDEIDDQLIECQYNGEGRKVLHDCAVLGTGILKGPIVVNRVRKAWAPMKDSNDPSVFVLEIVEEKKPASESVSPWNCFPDPSCGGNPHNGRGIFELKTMSGKQLRELAKQPGYLAEQIGKVLEEGPQKSEYSAEDSQRHQSDGQTKPADREHYLVWEYWGEFTPEDMRTAGVDVPDSCTDTISGCTIIVNKTVIKGFLNPVETGDIPYDFVPWELVDDSPWGYGVPFLMRPSQRVLNAAWRQLMDNSGLSVGPQLFLKRRGVTPADGQNQLTGRKIWYCDDTVNPKEAMAMVDIPNHGQEIQQIIDLAMKFADEEASVPALNQGEKPNVPDTVGGMTILMNSSNVVLTRMVKQFDDCITRPHIRRYYDWNMAYSQNASIKGDFQVDARGSAALLVRDLQAQALLQLGQYQGSGIIAPFVNWESWFKQVLKLQHIDPTDIMKSEAEIAALQQTPPQDTPDQVRANAMLQVAQIRAGAAQQVAGAKVQGEVAYAGKMQEIEFQNAAARRQEAQDKLQLAMLQYAHEQKMSLEQVQAELAKTAMQERTKREVAAAGNQLRENEGHHDRAHDANMASHQAALDYQQPTDPGTP